MSQNKHTESPEVITAAVKKISEIVSKLTGIQLGDRQFSMVENRLRNRMGKIGIESLSDYLDYLVKNEESEKQALVSLMTTHHTYFFREFPHFEFLISSGLQQLIQNARDRGEKKIRVWSAACSRGHEVYSIAMFLQQHLKIAAPDFQFEIWGTDIDQESVDHAINGVYRNDELEKSPAVYLTGSVIVGKATALGYSKVKSHLKEHCHFSVVNLFESDKFLEGRKFDLVFCRNVYIYFDQNQMIHLTKKMLKHIDPKGYLILGVSESLTGLDLPVELLQTSIYRHKAAVELSNKAAKTSSKGKIYDVLCVDDSKAILSLLQKVLTEKDGFRVKAMASNGKEALEILKKEKFDIITLDLNMPEIDGLEFLKAGGGQKTPVLIVSAVSREDREGAQTALALGAKDYVEKPSMKDLAVTGNEIRAKLKIILELPKNRSVSEKAQTFSSKSRQHSPNESLHKSAASNHRHTIVAAKGSKVAPSSSQNLRVAGTDQIVSKNDGTVAASISSEKVTSMGSRKIKTLIVDDSETIRKVMQIMLSQDPDFEIVGMVENPLEVEAAIKKVKPDLITLDIHMPQMDGLTLLKKIHPIYQIPTVMISSISSSEGPIVLQSLESGAVDYIEKPSLKDLDQQAEMIRERLKVAARAKVVKSRVSGVKIKKNIITKTASPLIVIGASTGGTEALRAVLESMPSEIPPILIVQHIPAHFSKAFADRLNQLLPFAVREAKDNDEVKPNQVLIAPGGTQMKFLKEGRNWRVKIRDDAPVNRHKPSVDYLFDSVCAANISNVVGVVLTGMGADGAKGLKNLKDKGARTIAQDEETCVVFGMPKEAIRLGGAEKVLPLEKVAEGIFSFLSEITEKKAS